MFRSIPTATRYLLLANIIAFIVCVLVGGTPQQGYYLNNLFGLHFFMASDFHIYQLFTYMFMHGGWEHLFFNMFALWMFGRIVEQIWGPHKFFFFYLICGLGAGLMQEIAQFFSVYTQFYQAAPISMGKALEVMHQYSAQLNGLTTVGASGAIYAILLAFGMIFPNERIFIFPLPVPIKAKWFVCGYAAIELFSAIHSSGDGVAHVAHLGGMLFGYFLIRYWQHHPSSDFSNFSNDPLFGRFSRWKQQVKNNQRQESQKWHYAESQPETESTSTSETTSSSAAEERQKEVDAILEKIRRNGYESLTVEEKRKLFDFHQ